MQATRQVCNRRRVDAFLAGPLEVVPYTDEDAAFGGTVRAKLETERAMMASM